MQRRPHSSPLKLISDPKAALSQRSTPPLSPPWLLARLLLESLRWTSSAPGAAAVPSRLLLCARSWPGNRRSCGEALAEGTRDRKAKGKPGEPGRCCWLGWGGRRPLPPLLLRGTELLPPPAAAGPCLAMLRLGVGGRAGEPCCAAGAAGRAAGEPLRAGAPAPMPPLIHAGGWYGERFRGTSTRPYCKEAGDGVERQSNGGLSLGFLPTVPALSPTAGPWHHANSNACPTSPAHRAGLPLPILF